VVSLLLLWLGVGAPPLTCCMVGLLARRFSTGSDVNNSDALIQEHYSKEVNYSIGPVSIKQQQHLYCSDFVPQMPLLPLHLILQEQQGWFQQRLGLSSVGLCAGQPHGHTRTL